MRGARHVRAGLSPGVLSVSGVGNCNDNAGYALSFILPNSAPFVRPAPVRRHVRRPIKHMRYAGPVMKHTVCIAAVGKSLRNGYPAVFLCSDSSIEIEGVAKGTVRFKGMLIAPEWCAMFAGDVSKAHELLHRYEVHLRDRQKHLDIHSVLDILREPLREQQRVDIADYVSATRGMGLDEFLRSSDSERRDILYGFEQWRSHCELILIWFGLNYPRLFIVSDRVYEEVNCAVVGVGRDVARASLLQRGYPKEVLFEEAAYYAYEAKKNSERVPGVGIETFMAVLSYDRAHQATILHFLEGDAMDLLEKQYAAYGPHVFDMSCPDVLDLSFLEVSQDSEQTADGGLRMHVFQESHESSHES